MQITLIGHNTLLIACGGQRILTDPYFGLEGNPFYIRVTPPALPREALRDVSLVLVSHTHWDHIDSPFLRMLPQVPVLVPWQSVWEARLHGARMVEGMRAWGTRQVGQVTITAVPAVHLTFALGFVIDAPGAPERGGSESQRVYFAGDTFYNPAMREIGRRFALDAALIPVTTFRPPMTMGEVGAVRAARDLNPDLDHSYSSWRAAAHVLPAYRSFRGGLRAPPARRRAGNAGRMSQRRANLECTARLERIRSDATCDDNHSPADSAPVYP